MAVNFIVAVLSRLLLGGISLVIVGLLTRTLGPVGYGYYSLIFAYLFVFSTLADLGLYTIMVREISRPGADEGNIASRIFSLRLVVVVGLLGLGLMVSQFLPYPILVQQALVLGSLATALASLVQVLTGIFQKHLRLYYLALADVISRAVQLLLVWWAARAGQGLLVLVWIVVVAEAVHFVAVWLLARRLTRLRLMIDWFYWRRTLVAALPIAVSLVFVMLYFKLDTVLLSLLKPAYDVGVYSAAYKILETVIFLPAMYIGLVMPLLSRQASADLDQFRLTYQRGFNQLAIFAIPLMVYLWLEAGNIMHLIGGDQFGQSAGVLRVLAIAIMLIFFGNLGGNALVALDLQKRGLVIYGLGAVINVSANLWLIPRYSYYATAWTTVLTELFITGGLFWLINKHRQASPRWRVFGLAALATAVVGGVVYLLQPNFYYATLMGMAYFPVLYLLGGFRLADWQTKNFS